MGKGKVAKGLKKIQKQEKQKKRKELLDKLSKLKAPPAVRLSLAKTTQIGIVCIKKNLFKIFKII